MVQTKWWKKSYLSESGIDYMIVDFIRTLYQFIRTILSVYHFVRVPFCLYHFVPYYFVLGDLEPQQAVFRCHEI